MPEQTIFEIVRKSESNYLNGVTTLGKYVQFSMHDTIEKIDAYLNSKHTTGETDSLGREKPFFNIVTAAVNVWYRATDIDRKNIRIMPDGSAQVAFAFIANVLLQKWMKQTRFGVFLNQWGRTLARYGSAVVKFIERDGELNAVVVPWSRLIVDSVDFEALPRIEKMYKTPAQLMQMATPGHPEYANYDMDAVKALINSLQARETMDGQTKDVMSDFVEIYEVHGELPDFLLEDDPRAPQDMKDVKYVQQMHVVSYVQDNKEKGKYDDFCLYKGKERRDPYVITHLIEEDGRTLAIGAVEYLFDAQWMQNHTIKNMKDQLDIASMLLFQTADGNFVGRNVLTEMVSGDVLIHNKEMPLDAVPNVGHDITSLKLFADQWKILAQDLTSTPDAIRGNTQPSGTAWRQVEALKEEPYSLFEIMTENKGLSVEDFMRLFAIPNLKTKMDSAEEIQAVLDEQGIAQLDAMYVPREAVRRFNKRVLDDVESRINTFDQEPTLSPIQPYDIKTEENAVRRDMAGMGNMRFFKPSDVPDQTWKDILKDFEWTVNVEVTNENTDKQAVLTTLSTIFQALARINPEKANMVLNRILTETGVISPLELQTRDNFSALPAPAIGGAPDSSGLPAPTPAPLAPMNA